jgi:hypothetical protein
LQAPEPSLFAEEAPQDPRVRERKQWVVFRNRRHDPLAGCEHVQMLGDADFAGIAIHAVRFLSARH